VKEEIVHRFHDDYLAGLDNSTAREKPRRVKAGFLPDV
jgi:hypothetical protein